MRRPATIAIAAVLLIAGASHGIEINLAYSGDGNPLPGVTPTYDPLGIRLLNVANAAADHWEEIIHDSGTFNINIQWNSFSSFNFLGRADETTHRYIGFNVRPWFIDDSGADHSEFQLGFLDDRQRIYQETTATDQSNWFRGDIPGSLEHGLAGATNGSVERLRSV